MHYVIHWMGRHQDFIYTWFIKYDLLGCQSVIVVSNEVNTEMNDSVFSPFSTFMRFRQIMKLKKLIFSSGLNLMSSLN